jgi:hypothetical protein
MFHVPKLIFLVVSVLCEFLDCRFEYVYMIGIRPTSWVMWYVTTFICVQINDLLNSQESYRCWCLLVTLIFRSSSVLTKISLFCPYSRLGWPNFLLFSGQKRLFSLDQMAKKTLMELFSWINSHFSLKIIIQKWNIINVNSKMQMLLKCAQITIDWFIYLFIYLFIYWSIMCVTWDLCLRTEPTIPWVNMRMESHDHDDDDDAGWGKLLTRPPGLSSNPTNRDIW